MQSFHSMLLLAFAILFLQQTQPPLPLIRENATIKISDHVYVIPDGNVGAVPNVGIIVGSNATLVVDTGLDRGTARRLPARSPRSARTRRFIWWPRIFIRNMPWENPAFLPARR